MNYTEYTSDQLRAATNLENTYYIYREAERFLLNGRLRWKNVNNKEYLYRYPNGTDFSVSLGVRSAETEALMEEFKNYDTQAKTGKNRLLLLGRMYKSARLPTIAPFASNILRSLDIHGYLDKDIRVIGTNAIAAYEMEAQCSLKDEGLKMTEDLDLAWQSKLHDEVKIDAPKDLYGVIKEADTTWTVSSENTFKITNRFLDEVELLIPSDLLKHAPKGPWRALDLKGQEDLLGGRPVEHVVADLKGNPARLVAPDPRLFTLHKWMVSQSPARSFEKKTKDRSQSLELLTLIRERMPHYEFDDDFLEGLSSPMKKAWTEINFPIDYPLSFGNSKVSNNSKKKNKFGL